MERYTHRTGSGLEYSVSAEDQEKAIDELGRYENIGIEPGELEWMMTDYKAMKDAEEQGRLMVLPVAKGSTVYYVPDYLYGQDSRIVELYVMGYRIFEDDSIYLRVKQTRYSGTLINIKRIGNNVFLTREEAEAKQKEMEEQDGKKRN